MMHILNNPDVLENRSPDFIAKTAAVFERTIRPYHRAEIRGLERVPDTGKLIYVGNHNGFPYMTEVFLFTSALFAKLGMSRYPYTLAHDFSLKLPVINQFLTQLGCVRATPDNAKRVLDLGEPLLIYPGGDGELMRPHRDRTRLRFGGRTGYIRLALAYNRPIVPVVAVGGHSTALIVDDMRWLATLIGAKRRLRLDAWPLMLSFPWGLTLGPFIPPYVPWPSKIIVEVLEPITFPPAGGAGMPEKAWIRACADQVERTIEDALVRLEAERTGKPPRSRPAPRDAQGAPVSHQPSAASVSPAA